jgi:hypothetical protein
MELALRRGGHASRKSDRDACRNINTSPHRKGNMSYHTERVEDEVWFVSKLVTEAPY